MATGEDRPKTGDARKRRAVKPSTIDLEATEVRQEPNEPATAPADDEAPARPEADELAQADPVARDTAATGASEAASADAASTPADDGVGRPDAERDAARWPSRGSEFIVPALTGAAAALAVVLFLYFTRTETPVTPPADGEIAALAGRLEAVEARMAEGEPADTDAIEQRMETVESQLAEATGPDLSPLESRIAALEEAPVPAADTGDLGARIEATETALADLRETVSGLADRPAPDADLASRIDALQQALDEERGASQALREEIDRRMQALADETRRTDAAADRAVSRAAAVSVAVAGLTRAVDSGQPFSAELDALRPFVDGDAPLQALGAHAADGLPTAARLAGTFDASAVLSAGTPEGAEDGGFVSRLASSARSLVVVRPSGPVEGPGREAVVSRIEAALARGDVEAAHQEWQSLDEPAREATADWGAALGARAAADAELAAVATSASAALRAAADGGGG